MPIVRVLVRHPIVDAVVLYLGKCAHCRTPLSKDFQPCKCGCAHVNDRGTVTAFLAAPFHFFFQRYARYWRLNLLERENELIEAKSTSAIKLFCATALCEQCGARAISPDTMNCECGHSAWMDRRYAIARGRLPRGMYYLIQRAARRNSNFLKITAQSKQRLRKRTARRSAEESSLYNMQNGRCYYCLKPLGMFNASGAFVRDHIFPISAGGSDDIENIALTCHACNEDKRDRDEADYWKVLSRRNGERWVAKRQKAMISVRAWREERIKEDERRRKKPVLAQLDAIVDAEYETSLAKKKAREERKRLKEMAFNKVRATER